MPYASWGRTYFGHVFGAPREPWQLKPSGDPLQLKVFLIINRAVRSPSGRGGSVPLRGPSVAFSGQSVPLMGRLYLLNCRSSVWGLWLSGFRAVPKKKGWGAPASSFWAFSLHPLIRNQQIRIRAHQRSGEGVVRRDGCPKGCSWRVRFFSAPLRFSLQTPERSWKS